MMDIMKVSPSDPQQASKAREDLPQPHRCKQGRSWPLSQRPSIRICHRISLGFGRPFAPPRRTAAAAFDPRDSGNSIGRWRERSGMSGLFEWPLKFFAPLFYCNHEGLQQNYFHSDG
ncbi:indolepyruvate:ferredoxin oxidoreductase [Striga asiatica]|uniref:Indolepyruvate:ferredoxin oxidoreductase n=1 Tax=Striga asiatica TaxID=4170 RepID=A0A5A7PDC6_STRAF|nr:indolepyruvate:ferredoxin oxidoreductase [Striga asiatica]